MSTETETGTVRLSLSAFAGQIVSAVARDTLLHKAHAPYHEQRVAGLSTELVRVLARGNRQQKLTQACLGDLRTLGEELFRQLIPEPTREDLAEIDNRPLLLEIDEALVSIPWELLHDGRQFFCRRFEIGRAVYTPQPRRAQGPRKMSQPARMLVLCSDTRGDLAVAAEGDAIVEELEPHPGVVVRVASAKSIDFVRKTVKDFDIVHYAGHADYVKGDPDSSGWHLADGKLTARDVAALAGGRPMPLLVFSNGCQSSHESTWRGDDPGRVFGLANAFLLSGVKYYIGTQWEVVDAQSHAFARSFYAELARGRSVGGAVRRARETAIVADGEGALGWAGYVLYGDPSFVPLGAEDGVRAPALPTPASIASRESIKGVVKYARPPRAPSGEWPPVRGAAVQVSVGKQPSGPHARAAVPDTTDKVQAVGPRFTRHTPRWPAVVVILLAFLLGAGLAAAVLLLRR